MQSFFSSAQKNKVFFEQLRLELKLSLPGLEAHLRLAPGMRIKDMRNGENTVHALESAVLIILYPFNDRLHTVVILRNEYDGAHSGQISLPGGKSEKSDFNFEYTALREAREEIGIVPENLEIIGQLSRFYVKPSNFIIYPFIAYSPQRPVFRADPFEVQRVIEIDVFKEIDYDKMVQRTLTFVNRGQIEAPGFVVSGEFMWGATAMIFSELLQVLRHTVDKIR